MGNIVLLDDLTINKIAAGEVVERPASVVKELVENSIDAGATSINVEIKNGGISYIRITDNGKGIMPDDMEMAFERHATSKIRSADDLETVKSMGFRGEALASITAIAKVEMKSKTEENETGYEVVVEGGNVISSNEVGCPKGTTITVENLFYNTPVRYKFLKKDFTEGGYIEDVMTRIALVNPHIAIKLVSSGKTIIQTSGNGDLKSVIYSIYGKEIAENILDVNYEYEGIRVSGIVGKPSISRSNRSNQLFFVNKRYIKDKVLTSSAEQAFKGMITIGKFGFLVLNLEMNPQKVDVNVHPAKLEVRFEEESKVFKAVYHAIKESLLKADLVSNPEREYNNEGTKVIGKEENNGGLFAKNQEVVKESANNNVIAELYAKRQNSANNVNTVNVNSGYESLMNKMAEMQKDVEIYKNGGVVEEEQTQYNENLKEKDSQLRENGEDNKSFEFDGGDKSVMNTTEQAKISPDQPIEETQTVKTVSEITPNMEDIEKTQVINIQEVLEKAKQLENIKMEPSGNFDEMYTSVFGSMPVKEETPEVEKVETFEDAKVTTGETISIFEDKENEKYIQKYKFIGIAFSTYIIVELDKEIYIIDQHAAHERIMYERIKENYYDEDQKDSQLMLLPDIITLTHKEFDILNENMDMFRKAGFTLEEFGENTIKLTGVPNVCIDLDTKELFLETLDEINTVARTAKQEIEEKFIATVACKAAVKANMALTKEEVDSLMESLLKLPNPFTCPHGRPTAIRMSKTDIEKKFSRR
ncbi:MAG: DNA mismatch repair endonuclease MutL [Clostridia bacterium]|nr:DNA mismatch repair endonuclease MutL [Clostridia bacterium]